MGPLQVLEDKYKDQGFHVLGFFSNDFGNQGGSEEEIEACTEAHAVGFQLFSIDHVQYGSGYEPRAVFAWLLDQPNPGPANSLEPGWNFHKYLISRDGELLSHWAPSEWPGDDPAAADGAIAAAIEQALAR